MKMRLNSPLGSLYFSSANTRNSRFRLYPVCRLIVLSRAVGCIYWFGWFTGTRNLGLKVLVSFSRQRNNNRRESEPNGFDSAWLKSIQGSPIVEFGTLLNAFRLIFKKLKIIHSVTDFELLLVENGTFRDS